MEYILINDSKLKIILGRQELEEWDISIDELDYANPAAKKVFEGILGYAKKELGFDTSGYKVLLQLYPSKHSSHLPCQRGTAGGTFPLHSARKRRCALRADS